MDRGEQKMRGSTCDGVLEWPLGEREREQSSKLPFTYGKGIKNRDDKKDGKVDYYQRNSVTSP